MKFVKSTGAVISTIALSVVTLFFNATMIVAQPVLGPKPAELTRTNGAQSYLKKAHVSGEELDRAIQRAIANVGWPDKEPRI